MPKQHDADGDANGENIVKGYEIPDGSEDLTFLETFSLLAEESWSYAESPMSNFIHRDPFKVSLRSLSFV